MSKKLNIEPVTEFRTIVPNWESIVETLAIKKNPKLIAQIKASLKYFRKGGKGIPLEKIVWE